MAPLPPAALGSLARMEHRLQQLVDSSASDCSEAGDERQRTAAGASAGAGVAAQSWAEPAVTVARSPRLSLPASAGQPGAPCYAQQLELARLRQERDAAVREQQAALRRERDAAMSEAAQLRSQLRELQQAQSALEQRHAEHTRRAEAAGAAAAAEHAAQAAAMERLQAAHAALTVDGQLKSMRVEALETQRAVLLESYQALEVEHRRSAALVPSPWPSSPAHLPAPRRQQQLATAAADPPCSTDLVPSGMAALASGGDAVERLALSHSHLALAVRCAELQFGLGQAERRAQVAEAAAAAAEEQAAGLRLLLAKASGGGAAALQQRLDAACRQLEEARALGEKMRLQLAQAR